MYPQDKQYLQPSVYQAIQECRSWDQEGRNYFSRAKLYPFTYLESVYDACVGVVAALQAVWLTIVPGSRTSIRLLRNLYIVLQLSIMKLNQ